MTVVTLTDGASTNNVELQKEILDSQNNSTASDTEIRLKTYPEQKPGEFKAYFTISLE